MAEQTYSLNWSTGILAIRHAGGVAAGDLGGLAICALLAAAISGYSNAGSHRQTGSARPGPIALRPAQPGPGIGAAHPGEPTEETRRLAETVRGLAADRDQALARIAALERNLDGVTGTIRRDRVAGPQPAIAAGPSRCHAPAANAAPVVRPETQVARTEPPPMRPKRRPRTPRRPFCGLNYPERVPKHRLPGPKPRRCPSR